MGAWGTGHFENDDAADWADELESDGLAAIRNAFTALDTSDYIEAPEASMALAAASVVAALKDGKLEGLPDGVRSWTSAAGRGPSSELITAASAAVASVAVSSELAELWEESESLDDWRRDVVALQQRLRAPD